MLISSFHFLYLAYFVMGNAQPIYQRYGAPYNTYNVNNNAGTNAPYINNPFLNQALTTQPNVIANQTQNYRTLIGYLQQKNISNPNFMHTNNGSERHRHRRHYVPKISQASLNVVNRLEAYYKTLGLSNSVNGTSSVDKNAYLNTILKFKAMTDAYLCKIRQFNLEEENSSGSSTQTSSSFSTSTDSETTTSSNTSTPTSSNTSTPTSSNTSTPTSSNTSTPTSSNTSTPTSSNTSTPTSSNTSTPTSSNTSTPTSSNTSTPTSSNTSTPTSSNTSTPTSSNTSTPTSSNTTTNTTTTSTFPTTTNTTTDIIFDADFLNLFREVNEQIQTKKKHCNIEKKNSRKYKEFDNKYIKYHDRRRKRYQNKSSCPASGCFTYCSTSSTCSDTSSFSTSISPSSDSEPSTEGSGSNENCLVKKPFVVEKIKLVRKNRV